MSDVNYSIQGRALHLVQVKDGSKTIEFPWPIAEVLCVSDRIIVRLEPELGSCDNQNVYGLKMDGEIAWRVPNPKTVYEDSPFIGMVQFGKDIKVMNWDGHGLQIDPKTGEVLGEFFSK